MSSLGNSVDELFEITAVYKLHYQEVRVIGYSDIEDLNDIGVLEVEAQLRLIQKHGNEFLVLCKVGKNALYCDIFLETLQRFRNTAEYLRHASCIDSLRDGVTITHTLRS